MIDQIIERLKSIKTWDIEAKLELEHTYEANLVIEENGGWVQALDVQALIKELEKINTLKIGDKIIITDDRSFNVYDIDNEKILFGNEHLEIGWVDKSRIIKDLIM